MTPLGRPTICKSLTYANSPCEEIFDKKVIFPLFLSLNFSCKVNFICVAGHLKKLPKYGCHTTRNSALLASNIISSAISAGSKGCGMDLPAVQTPPGGASHQTHFTQSDGAHRTYLIRIPSNYVKNTPVPLIFSFHGRGKNSSEQEGLSQFSNEDWNPNGIAVYPQGIHVYLPLTPPVL
jgi:hypothetical protein